MGDVVQFKPKTAAAHNAELTGSCVITPKDKEGKPLWNPTEKGTADPAELVRRSLGILGEGERVPDTWECPHCGIYNIPNGEPCPYCLGDSPYVFHEKPAAKSSTNVATGATVCPTCGCPKGGGSVQQRAEREIAARANCNCKCHGR
jgi:hypothetical protein